MFDYHWTMATPMISTRQLVRTFHVGDATVHALDHVDLDVYPGEFVAVMGPSGSGKSTLMNILGCLDTPDGGEYRLLDERVSDLDDEALSRIRNEHIGFVFQSFHLLPRMSALDQLSGGQRQRVAIARALVNAPPLLLADEPTGNLDSRTSDEIMQLFTSLNRDGQTILMVTHEDEIAAYASRVIYMRDGKIERDERKAA